MSVSIDNGEPIHATRTQSGSGEPARVGLEFADPQALALQATQGRLTFRSTEGGEATAGFTTWRGVAWQGTASPFQSWMLTRKIQSSLASRPPAVAAGRCPHDGHRNR